MSVFVEHLSSLKQLPCFKYIEQVESINTGLSQASYKISADGQLFYAKYIEHHDCNDELTTSKVTALQQLSPAVFHHQKHWLITMYIEGKTLFESSTPLTEKLDHVITLMSQYHQLNFPHKELVPSEVIDLLLETSELIYTPSQLTTLQQLKHYLQKSLSGKADKVCCHGDMNFSNILLDNTQKSWLIDFECCCLAHAEFDIAMCIAINNLDSHTTTSMLQNYQQLNPESSICRQRLNYYLVFSHVINALWFDKKASKIEDKAQVELYKALAHKQWLSLQHRIKEFELPIDSSSLPAAI